MDCAVKMTLRARKPTVNIPDNEVQPSFSLSSALIKSSDDFFLQNLAEEVRKAPQKQIKRLLRIVLKLATTSLSFYLLVDPSLAFAAQPVGIPVPVTSRAGAFELERSVFDLLVYIVRNGFWILVALFALQGVLKGFRFSKLARAWSKEILLGLGILLLAVPTVVLLTYILVYIMADVPGFISPFGEASLRK